VITKNTDTEYISDQFEPSSGLFSLSRTSFRDIDKTIISQHLRRYRDYDLEQDYTRSDSDIVKTEEKENLAKFLQSLRARNPEMTSKLFWFSLANNTFEALYKSTPYLYITSVAMKQQRCHIESAVFDFTDKNNIPRETVDDIVSMTQSLFPDCQSLSAVLHIDPEYETTPLIVLEVTADLDIDDALEYEDQWHTKLISGFPSEIASVFCLDVELVE